MKKVSLTNTTEGHAKEWHGTLFDDFVVVTEWGKIGSTLSSKEFQFDNLEAAEVFLTKKYNEKLKKGYVETE